jgi:hypothetical protein
METGNGAETRMKTTDANALKSALQERNTPSALIGSWGGENLLVEISADGATVEYGCARGTISEKIVPDSDGKFSVKGFHLAERGGPTRQGSERGEPAIYTGTIEGNMMTFEVKLEKGNESVGTFKVEKGKKVRLRRCG